LDFANRPTDSAQGQIQPEAHFQVDLFYGDYLGGGFYDPLFAQLQNFLCVLIKTSVETLF
jgi:hypothetical protein